MQRHQLPSKSRFKPLKQAVLPVWNAGHRLAWRLGEYASAVRHRRFSKCAVCEQWGPKLYRRWVIAPELERRWRLSPQLAEAMARKESTDCFRCGAKLRAQRLAEVILRLYPVGHPPSVATSLKAWVETPEAQAMQVAEINGVEGLHRFLARLPHLSYSEFQDDALAGNGNAPTDVGYENLQKLTYADSSFDLVITSETLEHVPNWNTALAEIRRVLRPGGRHVFTVPLLPGVPQTFARSSMHEDGSVEHLATTISHPGGDWGYPVFTEFGADFPEQLETAGFDVEVYFGPPRPSDLGQVFSTLKPHSE